MTGCNVGNKELILLSDALAKNTNANELDLSNNLVFSVVEFLLKSFAEFLENNKNITKLILSYGMAWVC